ncbi:MAG: hypothetical protein JWO36_2266 [Myxococcales bacterium]|nr:hypothetical protein [Myxococcales bacterium]
MIAAPGSAHAGRTFYGWLYGTEVMPERGAELMTWVAEENGKNHEANASQTSWWIGPLIGITDQLELALPVEMSWGASDIPGSAHTSFDKFGVELRYRFVTQDPVDAPPLVPLLRVAVKRLVLARDTIRPEVDFVTSYQTGAVHALVDLGMIAEINGDSHQFEFHPGAGVSIAAVGDLRLGAEVFAEIALDGLSSQSGESWAIAGPNLAWSHGRTWISATYGIGIYHISDAPKVQWGIAF